MKQQPGDKLSITQRENEKISKGRRRAGGRAGGRRAGLAALLSLLRLFRACWRLVVRSEYIRSEYIHTHPYNPRNE